MNTISKSVVNGYLFANIEIMNLLPSYNIVINDPIK